MNESRGFPPPTPPIIYDYESPRDLSYNMSPEDLVLESATMESVDTLDVMSFLVTLTGSDFVKHDPDAAYRALNMALALYERMQVDPQHAYEGLSRVDLFAAALDTAFVWEFG